MVVPNFTGLQFTLTLPCVGYGLQEIVIQSTTSLQRKGQIPSALRSWLRKFISHWPDIWTVAIQGWVREVTKYGGSAECLQPDTIWKISLTAPNWRFFRLQKWGMDLQRQDDGVGACLYFRGGKLIETDTAF